MFFPEFLVEASGFTKYPESEALEITFGAIKIYALRGFVLDPSCKTTPSDIAIFGENCKVVIAQSINEASSLLTGDVFTEDEAKWLSDHKAVAPFLLMYFQESSARMLKGGYRMEKDGCIYTYDAFPNGKLEIRNWLNDVVPRIVTSLTTHLSSLQNQVDLVLLDTSIFGTTNGGVTVFDIRITGGDASLYATPAKSLDEINASLQASMRLFPGLSKDMCRHFYIALNESDRLKQFLGFFLFIERFTHSTYKSLSYDNDACKAFTVPERVEVPLSKFLGNIFTEAKSLSQRFHWCAMLAWETLNDQDVASFLEVKKVRDRLSHGEHIEERDLPVSKVKTLALKLLGTGGP